MQTANIPTRSNYGWNRRWESGLAIIKGHRQTAEETIERLADML